MELKGCDARLDLRRIVRVPAALALLAVSGCAAAPPVPGSDLAPGEFVGFAERADHPSSLAYLPVALDIPECGFSIGVPAEWPVSRERLTRDDGRRSLIVTVKTPEVGSEARDRFFDHALDPVTVDPTARIVVGCFENRTSWNPRRFVERYAENTDTVRSIEETTVMNRAPAGLAITSDTDEAGPTRRTRPFLVWKAGEDLWAVVRPIIIERDPTEEYVVENTCGPLVDLRQTAGGRLLAANPGLEGEAFESRAAAELSQILIAEFAAAATARSKCVERLRSESGLSEGDILLFARSAQLNETWFRDLVATIRPLPDGATGFGPQS